MDTSSEAVSTDSLTGAEITVSNPALEAFNKGFDPIVRGLMWVAGGILFLYVCFMFLDVILRYLFNRPIPYDVDITQVVLIFLCFFALAYTQYKKSHINVDLFTSRLTPRAGLALSTAMYILCAAVAGAMTWQGVTNSMAHFHRETITYGGLSIYPFTVIVPIGCLLLFIVFLRDVIDGVLEGRKLQFGVVRWILTFALPILFLAAVTLLVYQVFTPVSNIAAGTFGLLLVFILIFMGMPAGFVLLLVSVLIMGYCAGPNPGFISVGQTFYTQVTTYTWIVIPLYVIMSFFILAGELGTAAFYGAYKWIGQLRGGLGMAVVSGSTFLAAVVGTGTAATVTMGLVALPEMRRYKYADSMSTGTICAGATLGPIIPPSIPFIVYGIITQTSIGALFIAGIIPGVMLAISFVAVILVWARINPRIAPAAERTSWGEKFRSLPVFGPIVALFLLVLGGIYAGIFTVVEGGGIGGFGSLVIAFANRKMSWKKLLSALEEAMKMVGMIFPMVVGSLLLATSLGASGVSNTLTAFVTESGLSPVGLVILILIIYMLFGIVADAPVIIMLTIPILWATLSAMGIDLIWFGVLAAVVGGLGAITPPYAIGIFVLRKIACQDVPLSVMYKGILPFCLSTIVVVAFLIAFPLLTTWLPELMK